MTDATAHALLAEYFAYRAQTFPNPAGYVTTYPEPEQFVRPLGVFVVVEVDGADVGCGGIRSLGPAPSGGLRFEVKHLWLRPSVQGRGLGRALLAELERLAVELGGSELVLDTNASLEAAGGLYRSSGYVDVEPYNDNPNANVWLRRVLNYAGMTVNERLFVAGLLEEFDAAINARDREAAVELLRRVQLDHGEWTVDAVIADPGKYGYRR